VHINCWLQNGDKPRWGRRVHTIIAGFEYAKEDHAFANFPDNKASVPRNLMADQFGIPRAMLDVPDLHAGSNGDPTGAGARITLEKIYSKEKTHKPLTEVVSNSFHSLASNLGADFQAVRHAPAFLHLSLPTFIAIMLGTIFGMLGMFIIGIATAKRYINIPFVESTWNALEERVGLRKPLPGSAAHIGMQTRHSSSGK
jgi:hypothetical protein